MSFGKWQIAVTILWCTQNAMFDTYTRKKNALPCTMMSCNAGNIEGTLGTISLLIHMHAHSSAQRGVLAWLYSLQVVCSLSSKYEPSEKLCCPNHLYQVYFSAKVCLNFFLPKIIGLILYKGRLYWLHYSLSFLSINFVWRHLVVHTVCLAPRLAAVHAFLL